MQVIQTTPESPVSLFDECRLRSLNSESAALAAQAIAHELSDDASVLLIGDMDAIYADALKPHCASLALASDPSQALEVSLGRNAHLAENGSSPCIANGAVAGRTFDVIVCTEHVAREVLLLDSNRRQLARLLNSDGYLAIAALNADGIPARIAQFTPRPPQASLLRVSEPQLRIMLEEGGYEVGAVKGLEMEYESPRELAMEILGSARLAKTLMEEMNTAPVIFLAIAFVDSSQNGGTRRYTTMCLERANRSLTHEVRRLANRYVGLEMSLEHIATVAPELATVKSALHQLQIDAVYEDADILRTIDEKLQNVSAALRTVDADPSPSLSGDYRHMKCRLRGLIAGLTPEMASLVVVSKGDDSMLENGLRRARHFPATSEGTYAGHHPADSAAAISQLEDCVAGGAEYLVIPDVYRWWLDHYEELCDYLSASATKIADESGCGVIYKLLPQED